ncbi:roadblock/LC7 domain-containing protein [Geobacter sulfurreducens]|uniref:roadblock/LC7 domain-containing protein n=1 Tax=Geobacter sulfurreducens TaxID=35554 RepID=UPI000DBB43AE|nr:roadblock/LC7 domain-containing protein [Geobacter sulfurreducens]BBA69659.1 hypothetical protein YM18_1112 [Geobacter sulfurreducens]
MPFKRILTELVDAVPGATGAILADWEGEAVEQHALMDDYEIKIIGAHKGILLAHLKALQERLSGGAVLDAVITTAGIRAIVGPVGDDYSLVMTLERGAIPGRALIHFRSAVECLAKEIY